MKTHIACADEPIDRGTDVRVLCGIVIPKAEFHFFVDEAAAREPEGEASESVASRFDTCHKCMAEPKVGDYQYGVIPGEGRFHND